MRFRRRLGIRAGSASRFQVSWSCSHSWRGRHRSGWLVLNLWPRVHLDSHCGNLRVQLRALAIGRIPGLALDRAGIALVGAAMMVAARALPLDEAYKAIDLDTLTLLLGMMIVVAYLRLSGFLSLATSFATL